MSQLPDDFVQRLDALIEAHRMQPGALLPLLHAVQEAFTYVPPEAVPAIAKGLNLSRAEVHGVVTYYHFFRQQAPGRHVVQVCQAEACQSCGAGEVMRATQEAAGCASHTTRADGAITVEPVYCLGLCASGPAVQVGERLHGRMTPTRMSALIQSLEGV